MTAAFDLDEPYVATDPGDRDEHVVAHLRWRWLERVSNVRQAAQLYVGLGLHPVLLNGLRDDGTCTCGRSDCPPKSWGKHPIHGRWQSQDLDAERLDRELARQPDLNLGLRMGRQPNGTFLVTVDVDGEPSLLAPLEAEHGPFPPTLTARTGSGGQHLIYRVREGVEIRNRQGIVPGVDIRGEGGQIVVAPSRHRSGRSYEWINVCEPEVLP